MSGSMHTDRLRPGQRPRGLSQFGLGEPLMLLRARGCASSTTPHADFNFSSTYSESSIMRSANCSAGSPAKFLYKQRKGAGR
jgi:hypothetical protein